jgi:hypothetical protein
MLAPLLATLALAAAPPADLNALFADSLPQVKAKTTLSILLPDALPDVSEKLYPSGSGAVREYSFALAGAPDCGGANACFVAEFTARKGGRPFGRGRATLARGRHGRFQPLSCGASCSPPSISWRERGATYSIQARVGDQRSERRILVKMANEAIAHGPR